MNAHPNANTAGPVSGRRALITGATAGIGFYTAAALARLGAAVTVTGRDAERGAHAVAELGALAGHNDIEFRQVDHSTVGANRRLAEDIMNSHRRLDVLVNNVGRVYPTHQQTADGYEATLALCFAGPVSLTEQLLSVLTAQPAARVVNVVSSAYAMWRRDPFDDLQGREGYVGIKAHAHAKQLNLIWTFALAAQHAGTGLVVNAVNPGMAWTPGTAGLTRDAVPAWRYIWPLVRFFQRRASAEKAASTPTWLAASPEAATLTGHYLDGKKRTRPALATDPTNQQRVTELAHQLIRNAPTAAAPNSPPSSSDNGQP